MSVLDAVIILAGVIKQIADDAGANSTMSTSLAARVEIIPRILKKIPETSEIDSDLLNRMYGFLKEAHDCILNYKNKGLMSRMMMAGTMRARFSAVENNLGRCIDDLSFNVGVTSAALLESIRNDLRKEGREESVLEEILPAPAAEEEEEEEEGMDFAGFDEITSHIENLSSALKIFGASEITEHDALSGGKLPATSVVLYGDKIIVQNLKKVEEKKVAKKHTEEYEEHDATFDTAPFSAANSGSGGGASAGIIVFHIDNTSSMLREKRMVLTKDVLKRVIPNFLRMGFRVIVNAWASTQENKGRIKTREVILDEKLLQVLHGGASAAIEASKDGAGEIDDFGGPAHHDSGAASGDALIHKYLDEHVFGILEPKGRTDLYGSCFQLMRQCRTLLGSTATASNGPVYAFVLTDGEHNLLNAPLHVPSHEGEDYFGVFVSKHSANKLYYKFERTGAEPTVPTCETFLRTELDTVNGRISATGNDMGSSVQRARLTVTFVGIGDAETKPLSDLTTALGSDQCSFYGITEVSQCDEVFRNISAGSSEISVVGDDSTDTAASALKMALKFTYEDEGSGCLVTHGAAVRLEDHSAVQTLHGRLALSVLQPSASGALSLLLAAHVDASAESVKSRNSSVPEYTSNKITSEELHRRVNEFVSEIRRLRDTAYEVDAQSFGAVFRQLMADKKALQAIKSSFLSKHTRRLRQFSLFAGLGVWLRELEELVESQIASYRMNVEAEILNKIALPGATSPATSANGKNNVAAGNSSYLQPTQLVLFRLQNNMSNAGKSSHRVVRHVAAISNIRDRTMHIAGTLFTTALSLHYLFVYDDKENEKAVSDSPLGVRLCVQRAATSTQADKSFHVDWIASTRDDGVETSEKVQKIYDSLLEVADSLGEGGAKDAEIGSTEDAYDRYSYLLAGLSSTISKRALPRNPAQLPSIAIDTAVVFPCIALSAKFDPFTIVRSTYVFFTTDILCSSEADGELEAKVFCAQELWELCHASNHIVGEALPVSAAADSAYNMILPLAHTPLLFALYVERGRAYHSAVNVTADCMALTVVSLQWAKFFHDALFLTLNVGRAREPAMMRVFLCEALKAVMGLHFSINSAVMLPSVAGLNKMFAFDPAQLEVVSENVVISREDCAGITCSIAVAAMVAGGHLPYAYSPHSWNILLRTVFSRLAEAISGHKVVRMAAVAPVVAKVSLPSLSDIDEDDATEPEQAKDPGALENEYRFKLGELQGLLRKRLHVEWVKSSFEEKRVQVKDSPKLILACLQSVVELFLNKLDTHGLQSWAQASGLVVQALLLKNYGIERLKQEFVEFSSLSALERMLVETGKTHLNHSFLLPVCETTAEGELVLREATALDVDHLIMYIDALVATKAGPKIEYKPVLNPNYPEYSAAENRAESFKHATVEWDESLPCANIALIGNVNSGKSSISGILLKYLQIVPGNVVARLGRKAVKLGLSESLKHAWVMDTTSHERAGGFTIAPTWAGFQTPTRRYTIIDNPGHKDFCRNAAFGVFEADFVVLVMPADMLVELVSHQAEEHLMTAFCFGVRELVVAVNKMDLVDYSQEAFESVRAHTLKIMKRAGFKPESATFVPVSVAEGEGFLSMSDKVSSWYKGPCLLQACDELPPPRRVVDKPLRMVVDDVFNKAASKKDSSKPLILTGRVERGVVSQNDEVNLSPEGPQRARVLSIQLHGSNITQGKPGDIIGVALQLDKVPVGKIGAPKPACKGMIMTLSGQPTATVMNKFEVQLLVVKGTAFKVGYKPALTTHIATVSVHITRLVEIIGRNNTVQESNPSETKAGQTVVCEMQSLKPFAAETIHDMPRLSRFLIKEERSITAIGFIRRVIC